MTLSEVARGQRLSLLLVLALSTVALGLSHVKVHQPSSNKVGSQAGGVDENFTLRVYHVNDVHVHIDEINAKGNDCNSTAKETCYGGYARIKKWLEGERARHPQSLFLDAGDESTGTMFFRNRGHEKVAETLNQLNVSAMCLGNHEFDEGVGGLVEFVDMLKFPVLAVNVAVDDPNLKVKGYHVFDEFDLAVIGAVTDTTWYSSRGGKQANFTHPVKPIQKAVDEIRARGIRRIILLSHLGFDVDEEVAKNTKGLYYIVGGHTDTLLGGMKAAYDSYPSVRTNLEGKNVSIVQDFHWGFYVGANDVTFAPNGEVVDVQGKPILMTGDLERDAALQAQIDGWRTEFEHEGKKVIGTNDEANDPKNPLCKDFMCFAGAFGSDSIYDEYRHNNSDDKYAFGLINGGGCRGGFDEGDITNIDLYNMFPFDNWVVGMEFSGRFIWDMFDRTLSGFDKKIRANLAKSAGRHDGKINRDMLRKYGTFMQVSHNVRIVWDFGDGRNTSQRLVSFKVNGMDLDMDRNYTVITTDFISGGGDQYWDPRRYEPFRKYRFMEDTLRDFADANPGLRINLTSRWHDVSDTHSQLLMMQSNKTTKLEQDPSPWRPS